MERSDIHALTLLENFLEQQAAQQLIDQSRY
jgi:hypothetical protein